MYVCARQRRIEEVEEKVRRWSDLTRGRTPFHGLESQ